MPLYDRDYYSWRAWIDRKMKAFLKKFENFPDFTTGNTNFLREDGTFATPPSASGVPYTGATNDVDLGTNSLIADSVRLDLTPEAIARITGETIWDATEGTLSTTLLNGVNLQNGQELHIYGKAIEGIPNRTAVQFAGVEGNHFLIKKAVPSEIALAPSKYLGISTQAIANNAFGYVTYFGKINNVYTTGWNSLDTLYLDMTEGTFGQITNVEPPVSTLRLRLGSVTKLQTGASETGIIGVRPATWANTLQLENQTLDAALWVLDGGVYVYTFSNAMITSKRFVDVVPTIASMEVIKVAEIYPNTLSEAGTVKIYAKNVPTADIVVTINIHL